MKRNLFVILMAIAAAYFMAACTPVTCDPPCADDQNCVPSAADPAVGECVDKPAPAGCGDNVTLIFDTPYAADSCADYPTENGWDADLAEAQALADGAIVGTIVESAIPCAEISPDADRCQYPGTAAGAEGFLTYAYGVPQPICTGMIAGGQFQAGPHCQ